MNATVGWKRAASGALSGVVGTVVIESLLKASQRWAPDSVPPLEQEPGEFMVQSMERGLPRTVRREIPDSAEQAVSQGLGFAYGVFFGALFPFFPRGRNALANGAMLGLLVWAIGYLGWLPGAGLMRPIWRQRIPQIMAPLLEHLSYGIATSLGYDWLRKRT